MGKKTMHHGKDVIFNFVNVSDCCCDDDGGDCRGLPGGGKEGQVLTKASDCDGDVKWADGGSGSGSVSGAFWRPNVTGEGDLSWNLSNDGTPPRQR